MTWNSRNDGEGNAAGDNRGPDKGCVVIDEKDKKVIGLIQGDLPVHERPFADLAERAGMRENDLLDRIRSLKERGVMRRFGATLRHQEAGFQSHAMVAWLVPEDRVEETGKAMAGFREVTHCYQRRPQCDWKYNLYTMIHGDSREECRLIAEKMSARTGIREYALLFSEREFKKTSMAYF
jgi:siroheme decarboxylase